MRAIVYSAYGGPDVLKLEEVEKPTITDDGVLIRVRAAAANPYDWHFMRGQPYFMRLVSGLRGPKHHGLGVDLAGVVEAVGPRVTHFKPGDEVYGLCHGAFAEYVCAKETDVALKPRNLSFEQAAAVPMAALTALQGLRDTGKLQRGERLLIIGASGGVGTFAVQLGRLFGAVVTGVCSTARLDFVRALGADHVIDYTREDFTKGAPRYELIFQLAGTVSPAACRRVLTEAGRLVLSSGDSEGRWLGPLDRMVQAGALSPFVKQTLGVLNTRRSREDLQWLAGLLDLGTLRPVVDRTLPLEEVPAAMRHVEAGHTRGKVVISV